MRLLDQIAQCDDNGSPCVEGKLSDMLALRDAIASSAARYSLAADSARFTRELVLGQSDLLNASTDMLRVPSECCWIEWVEEAQGGDPAFRIGAFVEASSDGRAGTITVAMEQQSGGPEISPARFVFDFDQPAAPRCDGIRFAMAHDALDLGNFFSCVQGEILPEWAARWIAGGGGARLASEKRQLAQSLWMVPAMVFSFVLILNAQAQIETRPADLAALNRQRLRKGKPRLLDHSEVRLFKPCFIASDRHDGGDAASEARRRARLHHVRGHFVRRGNALFWRRPHLRGDECEGAPAIRTHRVVMDHSNRP
ncbi:hypothetical protein CD351_13355 [Erythrobacter sp. KY5]|uniref:hypothetical protein n=1 Tax=Erythrobacter sp. KY5 TaxID=2011159 RepID=UPI000DBF306F|nr:hypothetical protein [Erythrobacter sp. KY5]AWW75418.1 hypothetical protein CD351_13355 [Erythrobacter sp. KY5]